jgi:ferredoxin
VVTAGPARIEADRERCVGGGQCVLVAPRVFDQSEQDGRVVLLTGTVAGDEIDAADRAARLCPGLALTVRT